MKIVQIGSKSHTKGIKTTIIYIIRITRALLWVLWIAYMVHS